MYQREQYQIITDRLCEERKFIQVVYLHVKPE